MVRGPRRLPGLEWWRSLRTSSQSQLDNETVSTPEKQILHFVQDDKIR